MIPYNFYAAHERPVTKSIYIILTGPEGGTRKYCPNWKHIARVEDEGNMFSVRAIFIWYLPKERPVNIIIITYPLGKLRKYVNTAIHYDTDQATFDYL